MNTELNDVLNSMAKDAGEGAGTIVAKAREIAEQASEFLRDKGIQDLVISQHGTFGINDSFGLENLQEAGDAIAEFVESAGVPAPYREAAATEMRIILGRAAVAGKSSAALLEDHFSRVDSTTSASCIGYESLLPETMAGAYTNVSGGMEHFGVDTDKLEADILTAITVNMMKWHNTIAPRMLPTISSANPLVEYRRDEYLVYDLADSTDEMTPVLELYEDPSKVTNELKQIVPQATHDDIDYAGFIPLNKEIDLFDVSKTAEYGFGTTNRTDLVADNVRAQSVLIKANYDDGAGDTVVDELIEVAIPGNVGRLNRINQSEVTVRSHPVVYTAALNKNTLNTSAAVSGALSKFFGASTDKYSVQIRITPTIDIRTSKTDAYGNIGITTVNAAGDVVTTYDETKITLELVGLKLDARYSEENFRKSSIIATQTTRTLQYEVPPGRFYGADRSHQEDASGEARTKQISTLQKISGIGQDDTMLKAVLGFMDNVRGATAAFEADSKSNKRPGLDYAAGGMVNPSVVVGYLDFTGLDAFDDSQRALAIGGRVNMVLSSVICDLMQASKMRQQLAGQRLNFRALCSGEVLSKIIGQGTKMAENSEGVEYALQLPDGTIVEFITTTFDSLGSQIIMVPFLKGAPSSVLNFAHNRSCGTVVCAFTATHPETASARRLMASVREAPIPTNVVGAIINVSGIDHATFEYTAAP